MKTFDLEAFKAGQKAFTRDGRVAAFIGVCEKCSKLYYLIIHIEGEKCTSVVQKSGTLFETAISAVDLVSMVSRHQALIDAYDPEDTWQEGITSYGNLSRNTYTIWLDIDKPNWDEGREYRLHPHNDLIKARKKGAKIETMEVDGMWHEVDTPSFYEDWEYRIKPEPTTHCLAYDAKRFDHEQTRAVRARVVKKEVAQANGWTIIKEWEV